MRKWSTENLKVELPDISKLLPFIISQQPWALFTRINGAVYQVPKKPQLAFSAEQQQDTELGSHHWTSHPIMQSEPSSSVMELHSSVCVRNDEVYVLHSYELEKKKRKRTRLELWLWISCFYILVVILWPQFGQAERFLFGSWYICSCQ